MKKLILGMFMLVSLLVLTGCDNSNYAYPDSKETIITFNEYNQLKIGMSENEVWDLLGGKCTLIKEMSKDEQKITSYGCNGNGTNGSNATLEFIDGKLTTSSQSGLKLEELD